MEVRDCGSPCFICMFFFLQFVSQEELSTEGCRCPHCQTLFSYKESLDNHLNNSKVFCHEDTTNKPYQCLECGRSFTRQWTLDRHRETFHSEIERETFTCPREGCDMVFQTSHERPFKCSKCGKTFQSSDGLKLHMDSVHKEDQGSSVRIAPPLSHGSPHSRDTRRSSIKNNNDSDSEL